MRKLCGLLAVIALMTGILSTHWTMAAADRGGEPLGVKIAADRDGEPLGITTPDNI